MRKYLGQQAAMIRPLLHAIPLFLLILFSASHCHAQCEGSTISSIAPNVWVPGETYNITITSTGACFLNGQATATLLWSVDTGDINVFNVTYLSATEITATVTPDASDPTETACFSVTDIDTPLIARASASATPMTTTPSSCTASGGYPVQIMGACPTPTITSISPSTWFAGNTYDNVVIKGAGFTTTAKATADCPATALSITAADGSTVPVSGVTVVDKTKITATIAPPAGDPTETATVTIGTAPNTTTTAGQILGNQIQCDSSMGCTQTIISTTDGSAPPAQNVDVGQPIILTTPALPSGITAMKTTWTVGGTNIGSLDSSIKGFKTKNTVLNKPNTTFYWIDQGTGIPITYNYCVDIQGADPVHQCSPTATASFTVGGPVSSVLYTCGGDVTGCSQYGQLGSVAITPGPELSLGDNPPTNIGIVFNAADDSSSPPGAFSFVQLIGSYTTTYIYKNGRSCPYNYGFGLDNSNPYPPDSSTIADDNPATPVFADDTEVTADMTATMYLLWTSSKAGSIPVPLGSVGWGWFGDAVQDSSANTWSIKPNSGSQGYADSFQYDSTYPAWSKVLKNSHNRCAK